MTRWGAAIRRSAMYDPEAWRRSQRNGRERGAWVYVPADELAKLRTGFGERPPLYRVRGRARGRTVLVEFRGDDR